MNKHKILISIIALLTLSSCAKVDNFFEGKDNVEKAAPLVEIEPEINVDVSWRVIASNAGITSQSTLAKAVSDDLIIIADDQANVIAINRKNANIVWQVNTGVVPSSGPVVNQNKILIASANGDVIALDLINGTENWRVNIGAEILADPALNNNVAIIKTMNGRVYAFDAENGKQLWQYSHGASIISLRASSAPVIVDNKVAVGFADGKLDILDLSNGQLIWQRPISIPKGISLVDQMVGIIATPVINEGIIYVATYQGHLAAIELATGRDVWQQEMSVYSGMVIDSNVLYVSDASSHIWAIDKKNGQVLWRQQNVHARDITAPAIVDNAIVVGDAFGYVHWLAKEDGRFIAQTQVSQQAISTTPVDYNGQLQVLNQLGELTNYRVNI